MGPISDRLTTMPPGRHTLPKDFVVQHQRERILDATTELVAKRGYQGTSIDHIAKTARVALVTFYEHFANKEECFLAAFDQVAATAGARLAESVDPDLPWPQRIRSGLEVLLDLVAAEPAAARLCLVEAQKAGPAGLSRYEQAMESLSPYLYAGREAAGADAALPSSLEDVLIGGLAWLVHQRLVLGELEAIPELLPQMVEIALTPYLGEAAAREVARRPQQATA